MSQVTLFDFNETPVRVVTGADGEPWWVAADIANTSLAVNGNPSRPDRLREICAAQPWFLLGYYSQRFGDVPPGHSRKQTKRCCWAIALSAFPLAETFTEILQPN